MFTRMPHGTGRNRRLDDAELTRAKRGLGAIANVEFSEDARDVVLDGAFGQVQAIGDFLVRCAAAEKRDDLSLAGRQRQDEGFGLRSA